MDIRLVNPFIKSVITTMDTMLGVKAVRQAPYLKNDDTTKGDITGLVGFRENKIIGTIALNFPKETAIKAYGLFTGESIDEVST